MRATGIGSMPGTDLRASLAQVFGVVQLPWLPELPGRGVHSAMVGRTTAVLDGMFVDLQPAGWRLTSAPGVDQGRASSQLRRDLDDLEEAAQEHRGELRLTIAGPWTMAACLERPRGDRVLADHGARRDLAESLGQGLAGLLAELGRRLPAAQFVVQLDEPLLPSVLEGRVPTASGFSRHRSVDLPVAVDLLSKVTGPLHEVVGQVGLHCCAPGLDLGITRAGIELLSLDADQLTTADWDQLGPWLETGQRLMLGIAPTQPADLLPGADALVSKVLGIARPLGLEPSRWIDQVDLTPACGLAGWTAVPAGRLLEQLSQAAELLPEQLVR